MKHQLRGSLPVRLVRDSCQNGYQCPSASKLSRRLSPFLKTGLRFLGKRGPLLRNGDNLGESEEKHATGTVARPPGTPSCRRCSRRMRSRGRVRGKRRKSRTGRSRQCRGSAFAHTLSARPRWNSQSAVRCPFVLAPCTQKMPVRCGASSSVAQRVPCARTL